MSEAVNRGNAPISAARSDPERSEGKGAVASPPRARVVRKRGGAARPSGSVSDLYERQRVQCEDEGEGLAEPIERFSFSLLDI